MHESEKRKLKRQIEYTARQIVERDGTELAESMLDICNALLKTVERTLPERGSNGITEAIYAGYLGFAAKVTRFYERCSDNEDANELRVRKELDAILTAAHNKQEEKDALQRQYADAMAADSRLQAEVNELNRKLEEQKAIRAGLDKMYEECSPEVIEVQKHENESLFSMVNAQKAELDRLTEQHAKLEEEKAKAEEGISVVRAAIAEIPEEIVDLRKNYKEAEAMLDELRNAETAYSPENQAQLKAMIDELAPVVEENRIAYEVLQNRLESLKQQATEYDKERHRVSTGLVELITSSMSDLKAYLTDHEAFLDEIERTADAVAEKLMKCQDRAEEYGHWFEADKTPLEAMITALGYNDYTDLRRTLDVGQVPDIRNKFEEIRRNLQDLDYILSRCSAAVKKDLQRIRSRARQ